MSAARPSAWQPGDRRSFFHTFTSAEVESFARWTGPTHPLPLDAALARTMRLSENALRRGKAPPWLDEAWGTP